MKRTFTVALGLALVTVLAPGVVADHDTRHFTDRIHVGTAGFGSPGCSQWPTSGSTTHTWDVQAFENHTFRMKMDPTLDADVFFYDAACNYLDYYGGASAGLGETEAGIVPETARWAEVRGDEGRGFYTLTLGADGPALVPRAEGRFYVGGGGFTAETETVPGADEVPIVEVTNYGGAILPVHGVESTATIEMVATNLQGFYKYEFRDLQNEVVSSGCIEANAGATTVDVPAGSSSLLLFAGTLIGCGDPSEDPIGAPFSVPLVGSFEVLFQ